MKRPFLSFITLAVAMTATAYDPSALDIRVSRDNYRVWQQGETPSITMTVTNIQAGGAAPVLSLSLDKDTGGNYLTITDTVPVIPGETVNHVFTPAIADPGFYAATLAADGRTLARFNIGYAPEMISSPADMMPDFDAFWQEALDQLKAVKPQYRLTKVEEKSTPARTVWLVEMKSIPDGKSGEPVTVRGYLAEPNAKGKYPALITYQGYDSDTTQPLYIPGGDDNPDMIEFVFSTRGQARNNRPPYTNEYGDWFAYNFGDKDSYYYRGAFIDAVRALDFVESRAKTDRNRITAQGQSQGGALTIAVAGLTGDRIKAIAPAVPFLGDYPDYFKIVGWPANVAFECRDRLGLTDREMYDFLSYFDVKNLATRISCPVIMTFGLQDDVCPPHTNFSSFNNMKSSVKTFIPNVYLGHSVPSTWHPVFMDFLKKNSSSESK